MKTTKVYYYLLRIGDHSNAAPEIGAFDSLKDIWDYIDEYCSNFDGQLVLNSDGSVVEIKRNTILR